jgi:hypothetical protein
MRIVKQRCGKEGRGIKGMLGGLTPETPNLKKKIAGRISTVGFGVR